MSDIPAQVYFNSSVNIDAPPIVNIDYAASQINVLFVGGSGGGGGISVISAATPVSGFSKGSLLTTDGSYVTAVASPLVIDAGGLGGAGTGGAGGTYTLPIASGSVLGGVKIGSGVSIAVDGTISVVGGGGGGSGTVTSVAVTGSNGIVVAGSPVTSAGTIALSLPGNITPASVNGVTIAGSSTPALTVTGTASVSGSNTGDQDLSSYAKTATIAASYQPLDSDLTAIAALATTSFGRSLLTQADAPTTRTTLGLGTLATQSSVPASAMPALTGDITTSAGTVATSLSTTGVTAGSYTNANITVDAKGRITSATDGVAGSGGSSGPINYPSVAVSTSGYSPYYDSRTFSAIIGNATTDDAAAVRSAIATIDANGGGSLYMSPVRADGIKAAYKFGSALGVIPPNVSIKGPFETSALGIGNRYYGTDGSTTLDDTFLTDPTTIPGVWLIYADSGTTTNSFMKPWKNSTIGGIPAYYPSQAKVGSAGTPTQYPFFIEVGNGSQVTIKDLGVTNPYQLIYINGGWRTVVDNVTAQPYSVGIKVNNSYDVSRITRVHFECFWDAYESAPGGFSCPWSANFGYAFIIQRCDLLQVMNSFAYGYRYGVVLQSSDGTQANSPWATFTNCHFDLCTSSVIAQQSQPYGASFSNCMFTYNGGSSVVDSQSTNAGLLSFNGCLFIGNGVGVSQAGTGEVNINGCTFDVIAGGGTTFLNHTGGGLYATGNNFRADKPQYANTSGAASALLVGNRVKGTVRMPNTATISNFLAANNLAS